MFEKKKDNTSSESDNSNDVFRPAKGSAKVVIGYGVSIEGEIKKADEVQIDGEADITIKRTGLACLDTSSYPVGQQPLQAYPEGACS